MPGHVAALTLIELGVLGPVVAALGAAHVLLHAGLVMGGVALLGFGWHRRRMSPDAAGAT